MKKFLIIFLIFPLLLLCGFKKKEKPYVVLSSGTISQELTNRIERNFSSKQKINYLLVAPDGFKKNGIRVQISKKNDKTSNWGFSIVQSEDIFLNKGDTSYRNYIYIQTAGYYIIQFFYLSNKDYPFARKEFRVN